MKTKPYFCTRICKDEENINSELHRIGHYELDVRMLRLYLVSEGKREEVRRLSFCEACILDMLISAEEDVISNQRFLNEIWGEDTLYNLNSPNRSKIL